MDMIWIAGGIGITPFLSMAKHESLFPTGRKIQLIWVFRDPKDPTHDSELFAEARRNPKFDYVHWISSQKGRLDADGISDSIGGDDELRRRIIMLCGPPKMVSSLSRQLHRKGIRLGLFQGGQNRKGKGIPAPPLVLLLRSLSAPL